MDRTSVMHSWKKFSANVCDPTGVLRRQNLSANLTGIVVLLLDYLIEHFPIVVVCLAARCGCVVYSCGRMLVPDVDASILVLYGAPNFSSLKQRYETSSRGTDEEMSSMYANECGKLPKPLSPVSSFVKSAHMQRDSAKGFKT